MGTSPNDTREEHSVAQASACVAYTSAGSKPHRLKPVPLESRQPGAFHLIIKDKKRSNIGPCCNKLSTLILPRELCALRVLCVKAFGVCP